MRAEEGEHTQPVPSSQVVLLAVGHTQNLVLNHISGDDGRGGESQGLTQNTICRESERVSPVDVLIGSSASVKSVMPSLVEFEEVQKYLQI